jgi:hypothetical protein
MVVGHSSTHTHVILGFPLITNSGAGNMELQIRRRVPVDGDMLGRAI